MPLSFGVFHSRGTSHVSPYVEHVAVITTRLSPALRRLLSQLSTRWTPGSCRALAGEARNDAP